MAKNGPNYTDLLRVQRSGLSESRARTDTTALLIAKWIEIRTHERLAIEESVATILDEPERAGGVILTLLNLVTQYATTSMTNPNGLQALVDYLITQMEAVHN